jgi:hypothetical protein
MGIYQRAGLTAEVPVTKPDGDDGDSKLIPLLYLTKHQAMNTYGVMVE